MTWYACLFEAKSIQSYILRSGRLRHIVGASELIDGLTGRLLDDTLATLGLEDRRDVWFSRRAGGAVFLFSERQDLRNAFRDLWSLTVRQYAPGLEFVVAAGKGENAHAAYRDARPRLDAARNRQTPELPAGTPVTEYAPRTGRPAVARDRKLGLHDAATARFGHERFWRSGSLAAKLAAGVGADRWPLDLTYSEDPDADRSVFPFLPDNRYLGLVHADGNGLGQVLKGLADHAKGHPEHFIELFRGFSKGIDRATRAAARRATDQVLVPAAGDDGVMPARPIVLGGDDLTLLVRADLAVPFAVRFLVAFEECSRNELRALQGRHPGVAGLPEALTAGAGIAFVKSNHPFHMAHELAESLAKHAKKTAKKRAAATGGEKPQRIPPTLSFHRVTTGLADDYESILEREMTFGSAKDGIRTTLEVYGLDPQPPGLPALDDLIGLSRIFAGEGVARGPARQVLTLLGQRRDEATRRYRRWREVMRERASKELGDFDDRLRRLVGEPSADLPVGKSLLATPLGDVATLLAVAYGAETEPVTVAEENP